MNSDSVIADLVDERAIDRLQRGYADVINRRGWDELDDLMTANVEISLDTMSRPVINMCGPSEFAAFVSSAVERFAFFEFVILNAIVQLGPRDGASGFRSAAGRIFMCEVRREVDTLDWSVAYGVYHDIYAETSEGWRIAMRRYQSLTRTDGPVFSARFDDLAAMLTAGR